MNITLIGMPGVGKSTIGESLAKDLGYNFIDIDELIEQEYGLKLYQIIAKEGEDSFLKIEESFVTNLPQLEDHIISTGGSVIYSRKAMEYLQRFSMLVFLDDSLENILKRIKNKETRGIIGDKDLTTLFNERHPLYLQYADIIISISQGFNIKSAIKEIKARLMV